MTFFLPFFVSSAAAVLHTACPPASSARIGNSLLLPREKNSLNSGCGLSSFHQLGLEDLPSERYLFSHRVSARIGDSLLPREKNSLNSACGLFSFHQLGLESLHSERYLCSQRASLLSRLKSVPVESWVEIPPRVHRSGRWVATGCYRGEAAARLTGLQSKEEMLWEHLQIRGKAVAKVRPSAVIGVASVEAEEENAGNGAAPSMNGKSGGKIKMSGQLSRWARARKIRAGKLTTTQKKNDAIASVVEGEDPDSIQVLEREDARESGEDFQGGDEYSFSPPLEGYEKCVYMVSDGTGWTADHSVHAALGQFEHCMVDRRCSVNTHLFSDVNDVDRLMEIIRLAGRERGMVVYTLADPVMADVAKQACELLLVPHIDILGPITEALANHLGVSPLGLPRGAPGRKNSLSKQYFKRIDAVEFTIKQDDGALPKNLRLADLVLVGVSRTSKTPLSTYIAQKGYKVANVPLVFGIDPPKELFEVDQDKVFGLTINANFLKAIRLARYRHLGVAENSSSSYSDMEHIRKELEYSRKLFSQNPRWPVIEVTGKAIEETAAVILRLYHERRNKFSMPRISTRY